MRYFAEISYLGTAYNGWQIQKNTPHTVQAVLNRCLSLQLGEEIQTIGCGRTDTGVHARQFFLHFDAERKLPEEFVHKLNRFLPKDIAVRRILPVNPGFHARFDARSRTYQYFIARRKDPLCLGLAAQLHRKYDMDKMQEAAALLLHCEDFESFSKLSKDQEHTRCTMMKACWHQEGDKLVFCIQANRFLRGMVRIVVGTLLEVGEGKRSLESFKSLLTHPDRSRAGAAAPAEGLFLWELDYGDAIFAP